ncbi:MAG: ABC transporter ATP-binding protein, partial [Desulfobulbaceae bacterium]|nr:ABC transporter ATP-binding protein [Desulfobulbaceae bacterium]
THLCHQIRCLRNGIVDILELRGITKTYGNRVALHPTDLTIKAGEVFSLVGESGSGKSTLAMIGSGMLAMDEGCRIFKDVDMDEWIRRDYKSLAGHIGFIFQNQSAAISHRFTIFEAVAEPLRIHNACKNEEELSARVKEVLQAVHLPTDETLLKRYPHQLNQGSLQRVGIARALALGPSLLIADEPTSSLDPSVQAKVVKLLLDLQTERGLAMLFITHDIGLARKISDRLGVMSHGRLVEIGPAGLIFNQPAHPYTKFLIDSAAGRHIIARPEPLDKNDMLQGCFFADNCFRRKEVCLQSIPPVREQGLRLTACHFPLSEYN